MGTSTYISVYDKQASESTKKVAFTKVNATLNLTTSASLVLSSKLIIHGRLIDSKINPTKISRN